MPSIQGINLVGKFRWLGISEDREIITIRKFKGAFSFEAEHRDEGNARSISVIDVETTGLDFRQDEVIEIGIRKVLYDPQSKNLLRVCDGYEGLADPGRPLSREIIELTGIHDEDVRGQKINWTRVEEIMRGSDLVIAHNAGFDRPFLEKYSKLAKDVTWACSLSQVNWDAYGYPSKKLEILSIYHGFFVEAHRALADVDALIHLLSFAPNEKEKTYFAELVEQSKKPVVRVAAENAPFAVKDLLKSRGYSWDTENRYWHKKLVRDHLEEEIHWMEEFVYRGKFRGTYVEIPLQRNFSR